jgi:hypothetical protein
VDDDSKITVDVIVCGGPPSKDGAIEDPNNPLGRLDELADPNTPIGKKMYKEWLAKYHGNADAIVEAMESSPDVNFRYLFTQNDH